MLLQTKMLHSDSLSKSLAPCLLGRSRRCSLRSFLDLGSIGGCPRRSSCRRWRMPPMRYPPGSTRRRPQRPRSHTCHWSIPSSPSQTRPSRCPRCMPPKRRRGSRHRSSSQRCSPRSSPAPTTPETAPKDSSCKIAEQHRPGVGRLGSYCSCSALSVSNIGRWGSLSNSEPPSKPGIGLMGSPCTRPVRRTAGNGHSGS